MSRNRRSSSELGKFLEENMASRLLLGWLVGFHNDEALMGLWLGKREGDRDDSRERKLLELSLALQPL